MEFESGRKGSELALARDLRQGQIAQRQEQRGEMSSADVLVWSQAWMEAWPRAKTEATRAEFNVGQFRQRQGGLWSQEQAKAWLEAEWAEAMARAKAETARAEMWGKIKALAGG